MASEFALKRKFAPILLLYGLRFGRFSLASLGFLGFASLKTDFGLFLAYFVTIHSIYYIPVISYPQGILGYPQSISKLSTILSYLSSYRQELSTGYSQSSQTDGILPSHA